MGKLWGAVPKAFLDQTKHLEFTPLPGAKFSPVAIAVETEREGIYLRHA